MGDYGCCHHRGNEWVWIIIAIIVISCLSGDGLGGLFGGGCGSCDDFDRC
ncbi:MAG: hypothetical protein LBL34_00345 [Clostridiales bacterium]|nr:hypothetical protein [Clostridiales bacterium]